MAQTETKSDTFLTERQRRAVAALLSESSVDGAAQRAKVSRSTLYRWLDDDAFNAELQRERSRIFSQVLNQVASAMGDAMKLLKEQVNDEALDPGTRQRAATEVLRAGAKFKEFEIEHRLTRMERLMGGDGVEPTDSPYSN